MAFHKAIPGNDIVTGLAVVKTGDGAPKTYDNRARTVHVPDVTGDRFTLMDDRYLHHGGDGGSGNWEH